MTLADSNGNHVLLDVFTEMNASVKTAGNDMSVAVDQWIHWGSNATDCRIESFAKFDFDDLQERL